MEETPADGAAASGSGGAGHQRGLKHKGKHDKPKPWDEDPNIDRWKIEEFDPSWNESGMLVTSSFSTLFPKYREKYLQEVWPSVRSVLGKHGIECELNLVEGYMTVSTTRKTKDPYIIIKARDLLKLLSRSVPAPQAIKILNDEMQCDIIKIGNLTRSRERFVKRRERLLGPNLSTLKAIEILSGCYILVQGNTVAAMGSFKGLKQVRRVVEDCIQNVQHPVYHIKTLLMKRELAKNPSLANENWDRFLPKFKKKNVQQKKVKSKDKKKSYTPFPPPQVPRKEDIELETGQYFLSAKTKSARKWQEKLEKQAEKMAENKRKREAAFVPPKESSSKMSDSTKSNNDQNDVAAVTKSLKKKAKEFQKHEAQANIKAESYIANAENPPRKKFKSSESG